MHLLGAIHTDANADIIILDDLRPGFVQQRSVSLKSKPYIAQVAAQTFTSLRESCRADQTRLAAVKRYRDRTLTRLVAVMPDACDAGIEYGIRHERRPVTPSVIALVVDVAIRAIQVTA